MYCLICKPLIGLAIISQITDQSKWDDVFINSYVCPECGRYHYCTSQSGDMIQENLELGIWED